jgi:hypothetical protein
MGPLDGMMLLHPAQDSARTQTAVLAHWDAEIRFAPNYCYVAGKVALRADLGQRMMYGTRMQLLRVANPQQLSQHRIPQII